MSLDAAVFVEAKNAPANGLASDPAASILKHSVKIWAREHGVAEGELSRLTEKVVAYARSAIIDCRHGTHADA